MEDVTGKLQVYIDALPKERQQVILQLRRTIKENLPSGFEETVNKKFIHFVVPHSTYPNGYHCNPQDALPFVSMASQKNFIAIYHMGIYAFPEIHEWFITEYPKHVKSKLDMGKSCIRLKKPEDIPYDLIAELCRKLTVAQWIEKYEETIKR